MITRIESTQADDVLEIRWAMNNVCNFKCRYCFPGSNDGNFRSPNSLSLIVDNFNSMLNQYKEVLGKEVFHLKILGGEPTMWSDLGEFIKAIKQQHNVYVSIVSNGSRTLRWWEENGHLIDNLILSYHYEQADLDHTIAVADAVHKLGKKVTVHVLMDDKHWDQCVGAIDYMKQNSKEHWMIQTKEIVTTENNTVQYTDDQRVFLQREMKRFPKIIWLLKNYKLFFNGAIRRYESVFHTEDDESTATAEYYLTTQQNNFKNWVCNIGLESVYIDYDGELKGSCGVKIFDGTVFNILDKDFASRFKILPIPTVCPYDKCTCPPETHISKAIHFR